jgi:hypothetical protein
VLVWHFWSKAVDSVSSSFAYALVHSPLQRRDQIVGLVWQAYPAAAHFDHVLDLLESSGMPRQNRSRVKSALKSSGLVSQGTNPRTLRINPRHKDRLDKLYRPILGLPQPIEVCDSEAPVPAGTLPLDRAYIRRIVEQVNEGYFARHYDSAAVMLRRLVESLVIETYVYSGRQGEIRRGSAFLMLDQLILAFDKDGSIVKSRNLVTQLRKVKDVGDSAAHSRTYVTKKADVDDIKFDARRALSELSVLAGL